MNAAPWQSVFEGIPYYVRDGAETKEAGDLSEVLGRRLRGRLDSDTVRIPIASLFAIAKRIEAQSSTIVALSGGSGPTLDADALAAYEAEMEAAERAAVKRGILVTDSDEDSCWSALYDHGGNLVEQGHGSSVNATVRNNSWAVVVQDFPGILDADAGEDFPDTIDQVKRMVIQRANEREAAE